MAIQVRPATSDDIDFIVEELVATYQNINDETGIQLYHAKPPMIRKQTKKRLKDEHSRFVYLIAEKRSHYGLAMMLLEENICTIQVLTCKNKSSMKEFLKEAIKFLKDEGITQIRCEQLHGSTVHQVFKEAKFKEYLVNMSKEI